MLKGTAIVAAAALGSLAFPAVVIDSFTSGPFSYSRSTLGTSSVRVSGTMLGGTRWTLSNVTANPSGSTLTVNVGSGVATFNAGDGLVHTSELRYGYTLGGGLADLNANLTSGGLSALKVSFLENTGNLNLLVQLRRTVGSSAQWGTYSTVVAAQSTPFDVLVPYSVFGSFNLADVDQVILRFTNQAGADYKLGSVEAVPEPATIAALGLGAAALLRRRRR
ncbi:MAG: PEP-CTERM sorting domain-containing protein [Fimbriimonadales bacterium]|nr:PEP-CTERM sorting domain-containing protein [Fimbriimonadales bacterium]